MKTFCGSCAESFDDLPEDVKECPICEGRDPKYIIPWYERFIYNYEREIAQLAPRLAELRKQLRTAKKGLKEFKGSLNKE